MCWSNIKYKLFEVANEDKNVPNHEKAFFQDQWTSRKMEIGKVDKVETDKIVKRMSKKEREILAKEKEDKMKAEQSRKICDVNDNESVDEASEEESGNDVKISLKRTRDEIEKEKKERGTFC